MYIPVVGEISLKQTKCLKKQNYKFLGTYWKIWGKWFLLEIKVTESTQQLHFRNKILVLKSSQITRFLKFFEKNARFW